MKTLILLIAILMSCPIFAGNEGGNGGDILYCKTSNGVTTELLDTYDGRIFHGYYYTGLMGQSSDPVERLGSLFAEIEKISPFKARRYRLAAANFFKNVVWVHRDLEDIPDSLHVSLPVDCELKQIAIQEKINGKVRYTIDARLWNLLNVETRAALILHEIIYTDALASGATNSVSTREASSFLISQVFNNRNLYSYTEMVELYLKRMAAVNKRMNDFKLQDGSIVYVEKEFRLNGFVVERRACGFILPDGNGINICQSSSKWMKLRLYYGGIESFEYENDSREQSMSGSYFGLDIPVYGIVKGKLIDPAAPLEINNPNGHFRCLPGKPILLKTQKDETFDLNTAEVRNCNLDPRFLNTILVEGKLLPVSSFNLPFDKETTYKNIISYGGELIFTSPQSISMFGQNLEVKSIIGYNWGSLVNINDSMWRMGPAYCKVSGTLTYGYNYPDGELQAGQSAAITFQEPCVVTTPQGTFTFLEGRVLVDGTLQGILTSTNVASVKFGDDNFIIKAGKISFEKGILTKAKLAEDAQLTVWNFFQAWPTERTVRIKRKIWSGTPIYLVGAAFNAYAYLKTENPIELPLYIDNYESYRPVKVVGHFSHMNGRLEEGILAQDANVPMLVRVSDYTSETRLVSQKLKAGTSIYRQQNENYYVIRKY